MVGSDQDAIKDWFIQKAETFGMDFSGQNIDDVKQYLLDILGRAKGSDLQKTNISDWINEGYEGNLVAGKSQSSDLFTDVLSQSTEEIIERIKESPSLTALERQFDYEKFNIYLKRQYTNQVKILQTRETAFGLSADEILNQPSAGVSWFARRYHLTQEEVIDLVIDRGLAIGPNNRIMRD